MNELNLTSTLNTIGIIDSKLREKYNLEEGERIISIPIKVTIDNNGKIKKEEWCSFMKEYNKEILKNDIKCKICGKVNTKYDEEL